MPSRQGGETFGIIFNTFSALKRIIPHTPQIFEIPENTGNCRILSTIPVTLIRDPLGAMEQGWGHAMEWGVWMGRWGVGKHLAGDFSVILGETLDFFVDFFD